MIRWQDTRKTSFTTYQVAKGWWNCGVGGAGKAEPLQVTGGIFSEYTEWGWVPGLWAALQPQKGPNAAGACPLTPAGSCVRLPTALHNYQTTQEEMQRF